MLHVCLTNTPKITTSDCLQIIDSYRPTRFFFFCLISSLLVYSNKVTPYYNTNVDHFIVTVLSRFTISRIIDYRYTYLSFFPIRFSLVASVVLKPWVSYPNHIIAVSCRPKLIFVPDMHSQQSAPASTV